MTPKITFSNSHSSFKMSLQQSINDYFESINLNQKGNLSLYLKTVFLFTILLGTYSVLVFTTVTPWLGILLSALLGVTLASIGFNVMHDAAHGSYSTNDRINNVMAYSLNLMGGISFIWKQKHNFNHHTYTNVEGLDDDLDIRPWMRTNPNQPRHWFHRFQHIYCMLLYTTTYLLWVYVQDFRIYFSGRIGDIRLKKLGLKDHFIFWGSKSLYFFIFLALPIMMIGIWKTIIGYLVASLVCGLVISVVFQLAHLVEHATFPLPDKNSQKLEQEWMMHQVATTANFANNNKFITWFTGGLNFQVEHHLFPKISHIHYPALSKLVRDVCHKFNVPYTEYPTFSTAVKSHLVYLKKVGIVDK